MNVELEMGKVKVKAHQVASLVVWKMIRWKLSAEVVVITNLNDRRAHYEDVVWVENLARSSLEPSCSLLRSFSPFIVGNVKQISHLTYCIPLFHLCHTLAVCRRSLALFAASSPLSSEWTPLLPLSSRVTRDVPSKGLDESLYWIWFW